MLSCGRIGVGCRRSVIDLIASPVVVAPTSAGLNRTHRPVTAHPLTNGHPMPEEGIAKVIAPLSCEALDVHPGQRPDQDQFGSDGG